MFYEGKLVHLLITGAAGFLGSHLSRRFLKEGHLVTGLDDFTTGDPRHIKSLEENTNFKFILQDVRKPLLGNYDGILNFACPASPVHYQADPVRTIETNFLGMINVLHLAKELNARVLQASTSEVYGDPSISPQVETYWGNVNPIGIRSCYDEGKRAAETLCFDYLRQYKLDIRVIRIFNTYGPGMAIGDGRVVSNFVVQALKGEDITIYGDGSQSRSFCFVSDLIEGIYRTFISASNLNSPINLGNPNEFTMRELAEKVIFITGSKSRIIHKPLPLDDPRHRCPDISIAKTNLNWEPYVTLDEGIKSTVNYFEPLIKL
jgi:UDP-glucuronate decarboxylase